MSEDIERCVLLTFCVTVREHVLLPVQGTRDLMDNVVERLRNEVQEVNALKRIPGLTWLW